MESRMFQVLLCVVLILPSNTTDVGNTDVDFSREDNWIYRSARRSEQLSDEGCLRVHPSSRDINKRFYAILPYFDKDHSNSAFLHKFRATVRGMAEGDEPLDKEAAFYAAVLTPLVFLQSYRDTWCLLERFHRALRLYQISHPTEKRSALKLLQNFRAVSQKIGMFVWELPGSSSAMRKKTTPSPELDEEEIHGKKDFRYFNEMLKNLE